MTMLYLPNLRLAIRRQYESLPPDLAHAEAESVIAWAELPEDDELKARAYEQKLFRAAKRKEVTR